jgi:hypothetical protein
MGVGPASLFLLYLFFVFLFYNMQENLQILIYKNIKNTVRNPKKLPECHRIGKRLKYHWISQKITKMLLVARIAHARSLLEAVKFLGEISGQRTVDSGRSEGEDSDDGDFDGRWWLMRENRRFEASGGRQNHGLFPARWGGKMPKRAKVLLYKRLLAGDLEASNGRKWEIGWERENRWWEERESEVWLRCER